MNPKDRCLVARCKECWFGGFAGAGDFIPVKTRAEAVEWPLVGYFIPDDTSAEAIEWPSTYTQSMAAAAQAVEIMRDCGMAQPRANFKPTMESIHRDGE